MIGTVNNQLAESLKLLLGHSFEWKSLDVLLNEKSKEVEAVTLRDVVAKVSVNPYKTGSKFSSIIIHSNGLATLVNSKQSITRRWSFAFSPYLIQKQGVQGNG